MVSIRLKQVRQQREQLLVRLQVRDAAGAGARHQRRRRR